eukprot:GFUD01050903.1.p1 GENE.GFUD01050903.1~~GFUD01050903.1.p1  ORF type:complete len:225 (-),score=58.87 GFUD01050903.1:27-701(-)
MKTTAKNENKKGKIGNATDICLNNKTWNILHTFLVKQLRTEIMETKRKIVSIEKDNQTIAGVDRTVDLERVKENIEFVNETQEEMIQDKTIDSEKEQFTNKPKNEDNCINKNRWEIIFGIQTVVTNNIKIKSKLPDLKYGSNKSHEKENSKRKLNSILSKYAQIKDRRKDMRYLQKYYYHGVKLPFPIEQNGIEAIDDHNHQEIEISGEKNENEEENEPYSVNA